MPRWRIELFLQHVNFSDTVGPGGTHDESTEERGPRHLGERRPTARDRVAGPDVYDLDLEIPGRGTVSGAGRERHGRRTGRPGEPRRRAPGAVQLCPGRLYLVGVRARASAGEG